MATTTNFAWETPDDTDLVKDGAAAMRTLGSNIDTSMADLLGGTTGQILSKTSATDMDFTWTDPVAGGMTLLSTTSLSGATTSVTSIDQTYTNLCIFIKDAYPSSDAAFNIYFNADSTTSNYVYSLHRTAATANNSIDGSTGYTFTSYAVKASNSDFFAYITIPNYANSTTRKIAETYATFIEPTSLISTSAGKIGWSGTAAISSVNINTAAGTFSGGTIEIYGVK